LDTEVRENRSRVDIEVRDEDDVEVRLGDANRGREIQGRAEGRKEERREEERGSLRDGEEKEDDDAEGRWVSVEGSRGGNKRKDERTERGVGRGKSKWLRSEKREVGSGRGRSKGERSSRVGDRRDKVESASREEGQGDTRLGLRKEFMGFMCTNIRSINNKEKKEELKVRMDDNNIDVLGITES
jgi:hypothetical protein